MDPITLTIAGAIATGVATKTGEAVSNATKNAITTLVRTVRQRFSGHPEGESALEAAKADPESAPKTKDLATILQTVMDQDPAFAADIQALWSQVQGDDTVVNNFHGQAKTVIQMRDVHGGLTIN